MSVLELYRGDDRTAAVAIMDLAGVPLDLTGTALQFTVKRRVADPDDDAVIVKTIGAGITITDEAAGEAEVVFDAADTDTLPTGPHYRWDIQVIDDTGKVRTVAAGRFVIRADITRTVSGS